MEHRKGLKLDECLNLKSCMENGIVEAGSHSTVQRSQTIVVISCKNFCWREMVTQEGTPLFLLERVAKSCKSILFWKLSNWRNFHIRSFWFTNFSRYFLHGIFIKH